MKFIYSGPASGVTLADGTEVLLWPNGEVDLPEALDYTQTLLARKHLTPVTAEVMAPLLNGKKQKETVNVS